MPTYEYSCDGCGNAFEKFEPMTSRPSKKCPKCGKTAKRVISGGAGFLFKGQGFYVNDYRSKSYKESAKKDAQSGQKKDPPPVKD